jgi:hypothetical protein
MYGRMTDIAEGEGGARRAWTKGAAAQKGHASKRSLGVSSHPRIPFHTNCHREGKARGDPL